RQPHAQETSSPHSISNWYNCRSQPKFTMDLHLLHTWPVLDPSAAVTLPDAGPFFSMCAMDEVLNQNMSTVLQLPIIHSTKTLVYVRK
ncbi:hypothetical protein GBF38_006752, partial [Nibea albiflora]